MEKNEFYDGDSLEFMVGGLRECSGGGMEPIHLLTIEYSTLEAKDVHQLASGS